MNHVTRLKPELKALLDRMIEHLAAQRQRSVTHDGTCCYRGDNGLMCAVGILIPDELYDDCIEGSAYELFENEYTDVADHLRSLAPTTTETDLREFLELVQHYHDRAPEAGNVLRLEMRAASENNYTIDLAGDPTTLRERMLISVDKLIDCYLRAYPGAMQPGWFA